MNKNPNRTLIVAVSCLINLCMGANYAWSVFVGPLAQRLNEINGFTGEAMLHAGNLTIAFSVMYAMIPISMIFGGAINDRFGPRAMVFCGSILFGSGMMLTGLVENLRNLVIVYGLIAGLGFSLIYTCTVNNAVKFFPDKKGLVGGLTTASYGISPVIFSPLMQKMIVLWGISYTLKTLGLVFMTVIAIGSFFLAKCPVDYELANIDLQQDTANITREHTWGQMVRRPIFYIMIFLFACGSLQGLMIISQASTIAQEMVGMPQSAAAIMVSILALFNALGRAICGYVSDKLGRINVIIAATLISLGGLLLLYLAAWQGICFFAIGICLVGGCFGCFLGVFPGFTADRFGLRNNSVNYGIMFLGFSLGSLAGPSLMQLIRQGSGAYQGAFIIGAFLALTAFSLAQVYRKVEKKERNEYAYFE